MNESSTKSHRTPEAPARLRATGMLQACGALLGLATVAGYLEQLWWGFELASPFRVQYVALAWAIAIVFGVLRRPRSVLLFVVLGAANLPPLAPRVLPRAGGEPEASEPRLRVVLLNLHTANRDFERALDLLHRVNADLILAMEVNSEWLAELQRLSDRYPHSLAQPRPDNFGIALFSSIPFEEVRTLTIGDAHVPSILARVSVDGRDLTLLGTHPIPPVGAEGAQLRNQQLALVPEHLAGIEGRVLVVGDLNCTPWSAPFRRLAREAGLSDAGVGRGIMATWPVPSLPFRIPLDHCLHSPGIHILRYEVGEAFGSDHFPLVVECALTEL